MHPSVRAAFVGFTERFEGRARHMYADFRNNITTGIGNLIDPVTEALKLPWTYGDKGELASQEDIRRAWNLVKGAYVGKIQSGLAQAKLTTLRISDATIEALMQSQLSEIEARLNFYFVHWDQLVANAQLAILSMAWAMGPHFVPRYPKFKEAILQEDYARAALESYMQDNAERTLLRPPALNPGLRARNLANRDLLFLAASIKQSGRDGGLLLIEDLHA